MTMIQIILQLPLLKIRVMMGLTMMAIISPMLKTPIVLPEVEPANFLCIGIPRTNLEKDIKQVLSLFQIHLQQFKKQYL